jgi:hypothetical protein
MNPFTEFFRGRSSGQSTGEDMEATTEVETERKEQEKVIGKIIKVSDEGWGFIIAQDIPFTRIFFHWTSLVHDTHKFLDLRRGMHVEFTPVDKGERGFHAIKVKVVDSKEN